MKDLSIPIILAAIAALSLLTLKKEKTAFMDMTSTEQMRGLAIFAIILSHYITRVFAPTTPYYWLFKDAGGVGVGLFLILSGYGLMSSYKKKGFGEFYLPNRILRVLKPYWIVTIIWIVLDIYLLNLHHSLRQIVQAFLGITLLDDYNVAVNPAMWFITFILLQYILFFVIFSLNLSRTKQMLLLFLSGAGIILFSHYVGPKLGYGAILRWGDYAIYFPVGAAIANNYDTLKKYFKNFKKSEIGIIMLLFLAIFFIFGQYYSIFLPFILIFPILYISEIQRYSQFLFFIGTISFELYLVHIPFLLKYDFLLFRQPYFISFPAYFACMVILAVIIQKLTNKIAFTKPKGLHLYHVVPTGIIETNK